MDLEEFFKDPHGDQGDEPVREKFASDVLVSA